MEMDLPDGVDHLETAKLKIIALSGTVVEEAGWSCGQVTTTTMTMTMMMTR